jgi:hypothetical protein
VGRRRTPANRSADEQAKATSWWDRINKRILAAGATAGALAAILGLLAFFGLEVPKLNPSGSPSATSAAGSPLVVDVIAEPGTWLESSPYGPWPLIPDSGSETSDVPTAVLSDQDPGAFHRWAANHDAIDAHHSMFRIVLRSTGEDAVLVTGLRIRILRRIDPVGGWYTREGACGTVPVRSARVDLDATPPKVLFYGADQRHPERASKALTLELRKGRPPEVLEVFATTERYAVTWNAELTYQVIGAPQRAVRIDNDGQPFRVTAVTERSRAYMPTYGPDGTVNLGREPGLDDETGIC